MLKIFNDLKVFFEDCYREVNVREYARFLGASPPTASSLGTSYVREGILIKELRRGNLLFRANTENRVFMHLGSLYWQNVLFKSGLLTALQDTFYPRAIVLFGSLAKAEATTDSDIDVVVFSDSSKKIDLSSYEKKMGRKVQLFFFPSLKSIPSDKLRDNILNGFVLFGGMRWK